MRRYSPLKPSSGTRIPDEVRLAVARRDKGCAGDTLGWASHQPGPYVLELDHVRASHGIGMKSPSTEDNLVALCGDCHRWKTSNGREARPLLLAYLSRFES